MQCNDGSSPNADLQGLFPAAAAQLEAVPVAPIDDSRLFVFSIGLLEYQGLRDLASLRKLFLNLSPEPTSLTAFAIAVHKIM